MVIGLLAVLKAGGCYLPLDPELPRQRILFILSDSGADLVLFSPDKLHLLEEVEVTTLALWDYPDYPDCNPGARVDGHCAAYLIYTSGSTGEPKGVTVSHRNLLNYCHAIQARLRFDTDASFALVSTLSADLGNTMIFPALFLGGALHVISSQCIGDPIGFGIYFLQQNIHYLKITPSHLSALMIQTHPERVLPSRILVLGGEATPVELSARIQALSNRLHIFNHYGPSETTVGVAAHAFAENDRAFPLGTPLPNTRIYLLDSRGELVAVGLPR